MVLLGDSLGKSKSGLVEPIPIQVKSNRGGLGREGVLKEIAEEKRILREKKLVRKIENTQLSTEEYRYF